MSRPMTAGDAKEALRTADGSDGPVWLSRSILNHILVSDVPERISIEVGTLKRGVLLMEWEGLIYQVAGRFVGLAEHLWTRKYWHGPLGLEQYLDLIRRAVEVRSRTHGDVGPPTFEDDGAVVHLIYEIHTKKPNLGDAFAEFKRIRGQLEEAAERASQEIGKRIAEVAARLSGWGSETLDSLVDAVENATTTDGRGRSLEELVNRLLETVAGFSVTGRIKTATEEIDISVLNNSDDPRFRRESALILAECKNWSAKCGKDEVVLFKSKIENRSKRCTLGLLVAWNGFTNTVTKELLRSSKDEFVVVPITGKDIRESVHNSDFSAVLLDRWNDAVNV